MNWILGIALLGACALALRSLIRNKKTKGTLCAGCSGCGQKGGCPFSNPQDSQG